MLDMVHENRGLLALDRTAATPEQYKDLIAFRDRSQYHAAYIKYYSVRDPSAQVPLCSRRYSDVFVSMFPGGWVPDSAILEGMFFH